MRVWLASFLLLFALAQLFQWMKSLSLPLPVFIVGGVLLAIASNYDKRSGWPFRQDTSQLKASSLETPFRQDTSQLKASSLETPMVIEHTEKPQSQPVETIWRPEDS